MASNKRRASNYRLNGINPLAYMGVNPQVPVGFFIYQRDPTPQDYKNFRIGDLWLNTTGDPTTPPSSVTDLWILVSVTPDAANPNNIATWRQFAGPGGGDITQITTEDAVVVIPAAGNVTITGSHNVNTQGAGSTVTVAGDNTITLGDLSSVAGADAITVTTGDITVTAGVISIPDTDGTGSEGVVYQGGERIIHGSAGLDSIFVGALAGNFTASGSNNTVVGGEAAQALTVGASNSTLGNNTLYESGVGGVTSGSWNTAVGDNAGSAYRSTESSNIIIGYNNVGTITENNVLRIGVATGTGNGELENAYIAGIDGVDVGSVASVVSISGDHLGLTTITAGASITVTPGANTITIAATGMGSFVWNEETGTSATMAANNGYIANNAGLVTLTLPAACAVGDVLRVVGKGAGGWRIAQNAGQTITWDETAATTTGVGGMLDSTDDFDAIEIVCMTVNTDFVVLSSKGNIAIT